MGLEPYLLASALNLVIAQRLIRRLCDKCKKECTLSQETIDLLQLSPELLASSKFYRADGCEHCNRTGYRGRLPIFEFLNMENDIKRIIVDGGHENEIREASRKKGFDSLLQSGIRRMVAGITTAEEVLAVACTTD